MTIPCFTEPVQQLYSVLDFRLFLKQRGAEYLSISIYLLYLVHVEIYGCMHAVQSSRLSVCLSCYHMIRYSSSCSNFGLITFDC